MSNDTMFKGRMKSPMCNDPAMPDSWWGKPQPRTPGVQRAFTLQHNFGDTEKVNGTNDKRFVTVRTKGE